MVRFPAEERNSSLLKSVEYFSGPSSDRCVNLTACLYLIFRLEMCSLYFHYPIRIRKILPVLCVYCPYFRQSRYSYIETGHTSTSYARRFVDFFSIAFVSELLSSLENIPAPFSLVNTSDLYSGCTRFGYFEEF